jgi:hypothetical protein
MQLMKYQSTKSGVGNFKYDVQQQDLPLRPAATRASLLKMFLFVVKHCGLGGFPHEQMLNPKGF